MQRKIKGYSTRTRKPLNAQISSHRVKCQRPRFPAKLGSHIVQGETVLAASQDTVTEFLFHYQSLRESLLYSYLAPLIIISLLLKTPYYTCRGT